MDFLRKYIIPHDGIVVASCLCIAVAGLLSMSVVSLSDPYFVRQSAWIIFACIVLMVASRFEYRFLTSPRIVISQYFILLGILTAILFIGKISKGAQSWFSVGGFSFQPSDVMKLGLIIVLAKYFSRRHIEIANVRHIIVSGVYALIPCVLVLLQPDFGSAMVLFGIWFGMVLVSGISKRHLIAVFLLGTVSLLLAWNLVFKQYQKARILNFINPLADIRGSGYNAFQSTIAVGSGGLFGKGIGYGTQSRLNFLPEYRTDFIFAAYAEEWGFVGAIVILVLFFTIFYRLALYARRAHSNFEALFTYGVLVWFCIHVTVNIGMNIGVMPVTGIPLPFMSYGGSHLLAEALALGMCIAMYRYGRVAHRSQMKNEFLGLE